MKLSFLTTLIFSSFLSFSASALEVIKQNSSTVDTTDILAVAYEMDGLGFLPHELASTYSISDVSEIQLSFSNDLKALLNKMEEDSLTQWKSFVTGSGEFDHLETDQVNHIMNNPREYMNVIYLNEIEIIQAVYKGNEIVGYIFDLTDYVRQSIIQDGAGKLIFTDKNLIPVAIGSWDS